ncbi:MAG: cytochrome c biogenesis protein CcsA [Myxococcales bacterium]|nr:cytochrome c biogenesis protein CcsA [Myxococcales bacterium]
MLIGLFIAAALVYGASSFVYGITRRDGERRVPPRLGDLLLLAAALIHTACIGAQCVQGDHPFESVFLVTSFGTLLSVLGYFLVALRRPIPALGAILAPIGLAGLVLGVLFGGTGVERLPAAGVLATAHIGLATAGLTGFTIAAGVAGVYLAMERRLRAKVFGPNPSGMSIAGLDRVHHRTVLLVTPVLTLAIVTGVLWTLQAGGPAMLGPRWIELVAGAAAWLMCVSLLVLRAAFGLRGRRAAGLTLIAFACFVVVIVYYGVRA